MLSSLLVSIVIPTTAEARPRGRAPKETITASIPKPGDSLAINGAEGWPTALVWLYDAPSFTDATGKVVVHWFCAPKISACVDDLARVTNLRENGKVYVIAYIATTNKRDLKRLDPIRESEGVGNGTLAYGASAVAFHKHWGLTGPASIVVDVNGKVASVTTGSLPAELDQRDATVNQLAAKIRDFVVTSDGPKAIKVNEKFQLSMRVELASYLRYSKKAPMQMKLMVPPDIKCDNTVLRDAQMKVQDQILVASVTCSGPRGSYEARATLNFSYSTPDQKTTGLGTESATWKFEIKP